MANPASGANCEPRGDDPVALANAALAQVGLDPGYLRFVLDHLDRDDASWRWCCGSSCDPCVQKLGRAVDAVRSQRRRPAP